MSYGSLELKTRYFCFSRPLQRGEREKGKFFLRRLFSRFWAWISRYVVWALTSSDWDMTHQRLMCHFLVYKTVLFRAPIRNVLECVRSLLNTFLGSLEPELLPLANFRLVWPLMCPWLVTQTWWLCMTNHGHMKGRKNLKGLQGANIGSNLSNKLFGRFLEQLEVPLVGTQSQPLQG